MAQTLSRNSGCLRSTLQQFARSSSGSPLVQAASVQVSQVATLKHVGTDRYPYLEPFPYWKKKFSKARNLWENTIHRMCEQSKMIVVDGNVGVGKHKFAERLAQEFDLHYLRGIESDDLWVQVWNGFNRRDLNDAFSDEECKLMNFTDLYNDPNLGEGRIKLGQVARMQHECYVKRVLQYTQGLLHILSTGQGVVTVRSPFSEPVFVRAMRDMGWVSGNFAKFHIDHWTQGFARFTLTPHLHIYLDAPPEVCLENIKKRHQQNPKYPVGPNLNEKFLGLVDQHYRPFLTQMRNDHEVMELDWAEAANESELDIIWEVVSKLELHPEDFEEIRYYAWQIMNEDYCGLFRLLYQNRSEIMGMIDNPFPKYVPEFKLHYEAQDELYEVYHEHPMTRHNQNYATAGTMNMLLRGSTLANLTRPVSRPEIHY